MRRIIVCQVQHDGSTSTSDEPRKIKLEVKHFVEGVNIKMELFVLGKL